MADMNQQNQALAAAGRSENPFFQDWTGRFGVPPFERIRPEHFRPAFARAFAEHEAEVAAIAADPAAPTFANTIEALESQRRRARPRRRRLQRARRRRTPTTRSWRSSARSRR